MDGIFFSRTWGYFVVRDPHSKINVYWFDIDRERLDEYQCARDSLEGLGFVIKAAIADGKQGVAGIYKNIPLQMCHFHQAMIMTRYLTSITGGKRTEVSLP